MQQRLPKKVCTSSAAGHLTIQQVTKLQSLPSTRTMYGTMLEVSISQDMLMVQSHLVHSPWSLEVPRLIHNRKFQKL